MPLIEVGHVGALRLDLPLDSLRQLCPNLTGTAVSGDEMRDTAILIARPGLRLIAVFGTVESEDGKRVVQTTPTMRFKEWVVTGPAGRLPNGLSMSSRWRDLITAYGTHPRPFALNGFVGLSFCRGPGLGFDMKVSVDVPINDRDVSLAHNDSAAAGGTIRAVFVPSYVSRKPSAGPCPDWSFGFVDVD